MKLLITKNFQSHFKVTLGIRTIKQIWLNNFCKNGEEHCRVLTFFETNYLANLDGATCRVTSQRSKRIDFYCNHEEADSKIIVYIRLLYDNTCLNKIIVSPDCDAALIFLYQGVINFTFLDALWFKTGTGYDIYTLPICCLLPAMHAGCDSVSSLSYRRKMAAFQQNRRNDKYDRLWWYASLSLIRLLVLHEENKSGFSVTELRYRTFTEKNLSGHRSPSTLKTLVLHLRRTLIFFLNYFTSFIKNKIYNIKKIILFA